MGLFECFYQETWLLAWLNQLINRSFAFENIKLTDKQHEFKLTGRALILICASFLAFWHYRCLYSSHFPTLFSWFPLFVAHLLFWIYLIVITSAWIWCFLKFLRNQSLDCFDFLEISWESIQMCRLIVFWLLFSFIFICRRVCFLNIITYNLCFINSCRSLIWWSAKGLSTNQWFPAKKRRKRF